MLDKDVAKWIQEFLLSQRNDCAESALEKLFSLFPIDDNKPQLKKMYLLHILELEISKQESVSETTLDVLESIEEMSSRNGKPASSKMKAAYCAVAVACTIPYVGSDDYVEIVGRVWWKREGRMEKKAKGTGLVSDEYTDRMLDIEKGGWDDSVIERMNKVDVVAVAVEKVRIYLEEAWAEIRPPMLDFSAKGYIRVGGLGFVGADDDFADGFVRGCPSRKKAVGAGDDDDVIVLSDVCCETNFIGGSSGGQRGAGDVDNDVITLPAVRCETNAVGESSGGQRRAGDGDDDVIILRDVSGATNAVGESSGGQCGDCDTPAECRNLGEVVSRWSNLLKRSLGPPSNRTYAPRPNDNKASNVEPHEKFAMRRKRKNWTLEEEDALVEGIKRFGEGNWKIINLAYRSILVDRTDVDLKDKWRNMNRWGRMKM
ncbi:Single myb histone 3-like protein [Drosera capensis]